MIKKKYRGFIISLDSITLLLAYIWKYIQYNIAKLAILIGGYMNIIAGNDNMFNINIFFKIRIWITPQT